MEPKRYNQFGPDQDQQQQQGPQYARPDSEFIPDPEHPGYFLNTRTGMRVSAEDLSKYVSSAPQAPQQAPEEQYQNYNQMRGVAPTAAQQPAAQVQQNPAVQQQQDSKIPYLPFDVKMPKFAQSNDQPIQLGGIQEKQPLPTKMKVFFGAAGFMFLITIGLVITALANPAEQKADTSDVILAIAHQQEILRVIEDYESNAQSQAVQYDMATSRSVLLTQLTRLRLEAGEIDNEELKLAAASVMDADVDAALQQANRDNVFDEQYTTSFDGLILKNRRQIQVLINNSTDTEQLALLGQMNENLKGLLSPAGLRSLETTSL